MIDIGTVTQLEELLISTDGPLLLYKHSTTCGRSAFAYEEVLDVLSELESRVRVALIRVQTARVVSNEIARRFGIRHESPQVILLWDGKPVWRASHYGVTAEGIRAALAERGISTSSSKAAYPNPQ